MKHPGKSYISFCTLIHSTCRFLTKFSTDGRKIFHEFLRCEYSDENILFWNACEEFKKESNPRKMEEKAESIYTDYISILSPKEVS